MWLATLDNDADLTEARRVIVEARLTELDFDYTTQTWIGLERNYGIDNPWFWVEDGSNTSYTNWWQGNMYEGPEPTNNWRGFGYLGVQENCVEMSLQGTWNDQLCEC